MDHAFPTAGLYAYPNGRICPVHTCLASPSRQYVVESKIERAVIFSVTSPCITQICATRRSVNTCSIVQSPFCISLDILKRERTSAKVYRFAENIIFRDETQFIHHSS